MSHDDTGAVPNDAVTAVELRSAPFAALTSRAATDQARDVVDAVTTSVVQYEQTSGNRKNTRGKTASDKLRRGVEALVGDLLLAQNHKTGKGWTYRAVRPEAFNNDGVSYRTFVAIRGAFHVLKLLDERKGFGRKEFGQGKPFASRFRATDTLLELADRLGVRKADANEHFITALPAKPLQLRGHSRYDAVGNKVRGTLIRFDLDWPADLLHARVVELNEFISQFELRGGTHRGFVRVYNNGDSPDFHWNKGGRLYSVGDDNYQRMSGAERLRMTIAGEPVCEIDIKASWLTIYLSWYGEQLNFSSDPYDRLGFDPDARDIVKSWFVATWGSGKLLDRWSKSASKEYRERTGGRKLGKDWPARQIRDCALAVYPQLTRLTEHVDPWARLMWQESNAVVGTMLRLKQDYGMPSLPVHDSIIVPSKHREVAATVLAEQYVKATSVSPHLVTDGPVT